MEQIGYAIELGVALLATPSDKMTCGADRDQASGHSVLHWPLVIRAIERLIRQIAISPARSDRCTGSTILGTAWVTNRVAAGYLTIHLFPMAALQHAAPWYYLPTNQPTNQLFNGKMGGSSIIDHRSL